MKKKTNSIDGTEYVVEDGLRKKPGIGIRQFSLSLLVMLGVENVKYKGKRERRSRKATKQLDLVQSCTSVFRMSHENHLMKAIQMMHLVTMN